VTGTLHRGAEEAIDVGLVWVEPAVKTIVRLLPAAGDAG